MPTFVHVTSEDVAKNARRTGLRVTRRHTRPSRGVFAMPVTPSFQITHQWVREMKLWHRRGGSIVGVYFRIPDAEPVWVGRYNQQHEQMTAAQAAAHIMSQTTMTGVEVIIPRRIVPKEILRVRKLPQLVGWRHYPEANGKQPSACPCCQTGNYKSRKIREKYAEK